MCLTNIGLDGELDEGPDTAIVQYKWSSGWDITAWMPFRNKLVLLEDFFPFIFSFPFATYTSFSYYIPHFENKKGIYLAYWIKINSIDGGGVQWSSK